MSELSDLLQAAVTARASGDPGRSQAALGRLHRALRQELPRDPLLAASCLGVVTDGALAESLAKLSVQAQPRSARARCLFVDERGRGEVAELVVELSPGGSGVWTVQPTGEEVRLAVQVAMAAALGGELSRFGVRWQLAGDYAGRRLTGGSLGLPAAVAARAALRQLQVPEDWAFTGAVEVDGRIGAVRGLPAKLRAAGAAGLHHVVVPTGAPLSAPDGVSLHPCEHLEAVSQQLFPKETAAGRSPLRWAWAAMVLVAPALAWMSATDPLEVALQAPVSTVVHGVVPARQTALVGLPERDDRRALRAELPQVLRDLHDAGAASVILDVLLLAETEHDDALEAAIAALDMPVIAPLRVDGHREPAIGGLQVGSPVLEQDMLFGRVRYLPAQLDGTWALSVHGLATLLDAEPTWTPESLSLGVTQNPLRDGQLYLPHVDPSPRMDWGGPYDAADGKVVLIGVLSGPEDHFRSVTGARYGVELHAAALEALAAQRGLRLGHPTWDALGALATGLATLLATALLPARRRWLGLLVPLAALSVAFGVVVGGTLPALLPLVLASILGALGARGIS
jgi:hypothetical protein